MGFNRHIGSKDLESEELTALLNHYLTEMSVVALAYGATIDKYIGDAILAFFGDPETRGVKEDAIACVNMAIAMQKRMRELRLRLAGGKRSDIDFRNLIRSVPEPRSRRCAGDRHPAPPCRESSPFGEKYGC